MSAQEQVAKLEALLVRVNTRRAAPRISADAAAAATPAPAAVVEAKAPVAVPAPAPSRPKVAEAPAGAPVVARPAPAPVAVPAPTPTPAPVAAKTAPPPPITPAPVTVNAPVLAKAAADLSPDLEVSVEEGVAEVDLDGLDEASDGALSDSVADLDQVAKGASSDEDEVAASSRRPIQLAAREAALDAGEAKPHPVPPESRRQVAIPSAAENEGDLLKSGVRAMPEAPAAAALTADITRPMPAVAPPAVFRGSLPEAKPATFGDLLDAALDL